MEVINGEKVYTCYKYDAFGVYIPDEFQIDP